MQILEHNGGQPISVADAADLLRNPAKRTETLTTIRECPRSVIIDESRQSLFDHAAMSNISEPDKVGHSVRSYRRSRFPHTHREREETADNNGIPLGANGLYLPAHFSHLVGTTLFDRIPLIDKTVVLGRRVNDQINSITRKHVDRLQEILGSPELYHQDCIKPVHETQVELTMFLLSEELGKQAVIDMLHSVPEQHKATFHWNNPQNVGYGRLLLFDNWVLDHGFAFKNSSVTDSVKCIRSWAGLKGLRSREHFRIIQMRPEVAAEARQSDADTAEVRK